MPNLNTASDIRLGTDQVTKVYLGLEQVWPSIPLGIIQQNFGIWTGTTMSVTLPSSTSPASTLALFVAGSTIVPTPPGWTFRESQVEDMGHYLFTQAGGANSWNITTNNGAGTWYVVEIANSAYDTSASAHNTNGSHLYATPTVTPTVGQKLLLASIAGATTWGMCTIDDWMDDFTEVADMASPAEPDYPMQGVAVRTVSADGITGYATTATYSPGVSTRSAIIAVFTL